MGNLGHVGTYCIQVNHGLHHHAKGPVVGRVLNTDLSLSVCPYLVCTSSEGSDETVHLHSLDRAFAARMCSKN